MPATGHALDFGCGLGRLSRALAQRFDSVTGVDVSHVMVAEASRVNGDQPNCRFVLNDTPDLAQFETGTFDLVFSLITMQHVSSRKAIRRYLAEFARVTAPGGVIVFQLPISISRRTRLHPKRLANWAVRSIPRSPRWTRQLLISHSMSLTSLPEAEVRSTLAAAGAEVEHALPDNRLGTGGVSFGYVAHASVVPTG